MASPGFGHTLLARGPHSDEILDCFRFFCKNIRVAVKLAFVSACRRKRAGGLIQLVQFKFQATPLHPYAYDLSEEMSSCAQLNDDVKTFSKAELLKAGLFCHFFLGG
eukprot:g15878.t1